MEPIGVFPLEPFHVRTINHLNHRKQTMTKRMTRAALAAFLLAWTAGLAAQQAAPQDPAAAQAPESTSSLERKAVAAREQENWADLYAYCLELHQRRPFVPGYMLELVRAAAAMGERQTAYQYMLKLQQSGMSYDLNDIPQTAPMRDAEAYQHINRLMIEAGKPMGAGREVLSLAVPPADIGDVAWDPSRGKFLAGTVREGQILAIAEDGSRETLLARGGDDGPWSIGGMAVDAANNTLWVASSAAPEFAGYSPAQARQSALFRYDLASLELLGRYEVGPDSLAHRLGAVAVNAAGDVYVIDRAAPLIHRKTAAGETLEVFAAMPRLAALTDIAVTSDNSRLFVADALMGVLLIDPIAGKAAPLGGPENLNLYGVSSIEYADGDLVMIQGGTSPQRIMRFTLDEAGAAVADVIPMAVALEGFDGPGQGVLRGDSLYFVANHRPTAADQNTRLMVTPLDSGEVLVAPDMRVFEQMMQERIEQLKKEGKQPQ
jgi:hypothetical protein